MVALCENFPQKKFYVTSRKATRMRSYLMGNSFVWHFRADRSPVLISGTPTVLRLRKGDRYLKYRISSRVVHSMVECIMHSCWNQYQFRSSSQSWMIWVRIRRLSLNTPGSGTYVGAHMYHVGAKKRLTKKKKKKANRHRSL
jgi:hypothetical protein